MEEQKQKPFYKNIFNLDVFIAPKLIKILYFLFIIGLAIYAIFLVVSSFYVMFTGQFFAGISTLFMGVVLLVFYLLFIRICFELYMVLFKCYEYLKKISDKLN